MVLRPSGGTTGLAQDVRSLSLDNLCAHFSHQAACEGASDVSAGDENFHAFQNTEAGVLIEFLMQCVVNHFNVHYNITSFQYVF